MLFWASVTNAYYWLPITGHTKFEFPSDSKQLYQNRNHYNLIVHCLLNLQEAQAAPDALVRGVHSGPHPGVWCAPGVLDCAALLALSGLGGLSPAHLRPLSLPVSLASTDIWGENLIWQKRIALNGLTHRWLCSTPFSSFGERERGSRLQIIIRVLFWTASGKKTCISSPKYFLLI